jgi:poly(3-hydroxybutyrate) depolymerase
VHNYLLYDISHAALRPWRAMTQAAKLCFGHPFNPVARTTFGRSLTATCELWERTTRHYEKPTFGLSSTVVGGEPVRASEEVVWARPFCRLLHFRKEWHQPQPEPRLLIIAPMSGHYATLLRGTVEAMLPRCDVYISDWVDASMVPTAAGSFDLDDYIDYVIDMLQVLGPDTHVMAVCQPSVPVLAAVALMEEDQDAFAPRSMILMSGPIDTRVNPTAVNRLATERGTDWFQRNAIMRVPLGHPGFGRAVYPGFLQLSGFMSLNMDRHVTAHWNMYKHLVQGDGDSAGKHREFYDEYLAVMDLTAEFYLQTIDTVFVRHALPRGRMTYRGRKIDLSSIRHVGLMTVEGEKDDISGVGQTEAAHRLCSQIPSSMRVHYVQPNVGHYGVFNGSRFTAEIAPRVQAFIQDQEANRGAGNLTGLAPRSRRLVREYATVH